MSATVPAAETIDHIVLFKVKDDAGTTRVNSMMTSLSGLVSLDPVLHLSAGPVHRIQSSPFPFTHMLHARYSSKESVDAFIAHPIHQSVVEQWVKPNCDDVMLLDWVAGDLQGPLVPPPGSALRFKLLKLKENLEAEAKDEILGVIRGHSQKTGGIDQITCGENFSPAIAKGYSIASLAVFRGLSELEAADSEEELANLKKEKAWDYVESFIVLDYLMPSSQSPSL